MTFSKIGMHLFYCFVSVPRVRVYPRKPNGASQNIAFINNVYDFEFARAFSIEFSREIVASDFSLAHFWWYCCARHLHCTHDFFREIKSFSFLFLPSGYGFIRGSLLLKWNGAKYFFLNFRTLFHPVFTWNRCIVSFARAFSIQFFREIVATD